VTRHVTNESTDVALILVLLGLDLLNMLLLALSHPELLTSVG